MKTIVIFSVPTLDSVSQDSFKYAGLSMATVHEAALIIAKTPTHFRCLKNRWGERGEDEKIPNRLLRDYILQYESYLTKADLIAALVEDAKS